jgi:RNA polymerase sigma factor (sigma-70 family)
MADERRFDDLYREHYVVIERYVRRRIDETTVSDVVAEVFTVAWRRLAEVPVDDARLWLFGVARHVVANHLRGAGRGYRLIEKVAANTAVNTAGLADDHADAVATRLSVAAAFDRLAPSDQEILRLVVWEGLTVREAAKVLHCGVPAATMRLNRARARLRKALKPMRETIHENR